MRVKYSQIHESLVAAVDLAAADQDSLTRLTNLIRLERELRTMVKAARDKAAYEAKKEYTLDAIKQMTGLSTDNINYWMRAHRRRTGAPPLYGLPKKSMASALDLSGLARPDKPSHPTSAQEPSPGPAPEAPANLH